MIAIPIMIPSESGLSFSPLFGKTSHVLLIDPNKMLGETQILENLERNGKSLSQQIIDAGCTAILTHHLGEQAYHNFQNSTTIAYYIADIDLSLEELLDGYRQNSFPRFEKENVRPAKKRHLGKNCSCHEEEAKPVDSNTTIRIAIPTTNKEIADHFGHCEYYTVIDIVDGIVKNTEQLKSPQGCGCKSGIADTLREIGVQLMLSGNIGDGAFNKISQQNIAVIRGCSGKIDDAVNLFLANQLCDSNKTCDHSGHQYSCSHHKHN